MNVIFAYNKMTYHYKPMNEDFIRLAKLAVKSAKKYYRTKFYGDQESFDFFTKNEITFDDVIILDQEQIDKYFNIYSISKIYGMMNETEPYILMDFDVVLFEKLESKHTITYGMPEADVGKDTKFESLTWIYDSYVLPFRKVIKNYYSQKEIGEFDWSVFPSFCVMMVKNPIFVKNVYEEIFQRLPRRAICQSTPTVIEQFLLHQNVVKYHVDYGFFLDYNYYNTNDDFNIMETMSKKFLHLNINHKNIKNELDFIESII